MTIQDVSTKLLVDIETARAALSMSRTVIYEQIDKGLLNVVKIGRRTYIPRAELEAYVTRLTEQA